MRSKATRTILAATAACIALAGALALGACSTEPVVGRSFNDQTSTFQSDEATFTPQDTSVVSDRTGTPLKIESSGWNAKDSYVHWGIMVENPNDDLIARDTVVRVRTYDSHGKRLSSDTSKISFVGPGKTIGFAGNKAGNGTRPARVEIKLDGGSTIWQDAQGYTDPFTIDEFHDENALYRRYQITGQITNHTGAYASTVPMSFICFDKEGKITGGYVGEAYRIKPGRTKSFKLTINTVPKYDHMEAYPLIYVEGEGGGASNSPYY